MLKIKSILPLSVMTFSLTAVSPVQAATFIPGEESEFFVGGGSPSQILDLVIPGSGRFNITFEFGSFNQIWGDVNDPRDAQGRRPAFWQKPSEPAINAVNAVIDFLNTLDPIPTQLVGRNLDPVLTEPPFNFVFGANPSFDVPQEPDGMTGNLLFAQGLYSEGENNWTNPTAQQLSTIDADTAQLYARFEEIPEPSSVVGIFLGGLSLLLVKSKSSDED